MSEKTDIWMPLYVAEYLADTSHLTTEQHGAYLLILMHSWRCGCVPDDDQQLAQIAKMSKSKWRNNRKTIEKFFDIQANGWTQKRLEVERGKADTRKKNAKENGKLGGNPAFKKGQPNPYKHNPGDNPGDNPQVTQLINSSPSPSPYKDSTGGGTSSVGRPASDPPSQNFDERIFDVATLRADGRCGLKRFKFVFLSADELRDAKKVWREQNHLSQDEWVLGMRRLNSYCESKPKEPAFKQLTGFLLTDALEQHRKKNGSANGAAQQQPRGRAYQRFKPERETGSLENVGTIIQTAVSKGK